MDDCFSIKGQNNELTNEIFRPLA